MEMGRNSGGRYRVGAEVGQCRYSLGSCHRKRIHRSLCRGQGWPASHVGGRAQLPERRASRPQLQPLACRSLRRMSDGPCLGRSPR